MITKQDLVDAVQALAADVQNGCASLDEPLTHDRMAALLARLPDGRTPYRPVQHYAPGGAAMVDAIERLERELNEIELVLDAHRAALVAAGWLNLDGSVRHG